MPRKCCVPYCNSNYATCPGYVTVFSFPKEVDLRNKWKSAISRQNFEPGSTAVVCIKHFDEQFIIREDSVKRADGSVLVMPRKICALTSQAYPTIFPDQPVYFSKTPPLKIEDPSEKESQIEQRDEENFNCFKKIDTYVHNTKDSPVVPCTDEATIVKLEFEEELPKDCSVEEVTINEASSKDRPKQDSLAIPHYNAIIKLECEEESKNYSAEATATDKELSIERYTIKDSSVTPQCPEMPTIVKLEFEDETCNNCPSEEITKSKELTSNRDPIKDIVIPNTEASTAVTVEFDRLSNSDLEENDLGELSSDYESSCDLPKIVHNERMAIDETDVFSNRKVLNRRKCYFGDFTIDDMASLAKARKFYKCAITERKKNKRIIGVLRKNVARLKDRMEKLENELEAEKESKKGNQELDEYSAFLRNSPLPDSAKCIIFRLLQGSSTKASYPPILREFASMLHSYSPAAYKFVRRTFHGALPHPQIFCKWTRNRANLETSDTSTNSNVELDDPSKMTLKMHDPYQLNFEMDDSYKQSLQLSGNEDK